MKILILLKYRMFDRLKYFAIFTQKIVLINFAVIDLISKV